MNRIIITLSLNDSQILKTFNGDPGVDLYYLPESIILEQKEKDVCMIPLCIERPEKMKEKDFSAYDAEMYEGIMEDLKTITDTEPSEEENITVIITVPSDHYEDFLDAFKLKVGKVDNWELEIIEDQETDAFLPANLCVIPIEVYDNPGAIGEVAFIALAEFLYDLICQRPSVAAIHDSLTSPEIKKRRKNTKRKEKRKETVKIPDQLAAGFHGEQRN